ncbi:hypothetical protein QYF36_003558 [Acer negundo]|nr:hypothetical protein QYF36_003558 [Acer negundo]
MFRCLFQSSKKRIFSTVTTHNAVAIPLEASIQHHKTTPSLHSSFDVLEHLVSTYRDSRCLKDAKLFHLRTLKLGFHYVEELETGEEFSTVVVAVLEDLEDEGLREVEV